MQEVLESEDYAAHDRVFDLALACALCAGEPAAVQPLPPAIREAPLDVQALWFAASTHTPQRFGRWRIVLASPDLENGGLSELNEDLVLEEMEARDSFEHSWRISLHTGRAQLAVSDWSSDGVLELRWNRGDIASTLLRFDDDEGQCVEEGWATWLLEGLLGLHSADGARKLAKKAPADSTPSYRRLWELGAFLQGRRQPNDLGDM